MKKTCREIKVFRKSIQLLKAIKNYFTDYSYHFRINDRLGLYNVLPDRLFLKKCFKARMGTKLNLKNPQTVNEKMQWLKLYNRNPLYTVMADKILAKEYAAGIIGEKYIIPTLKVWDRPEDIDYSLLPDKFVLKCNHNSGLGMYICKDKSKIDIAEVNSGLKKGLKQNHYKRFREWPYKNIKRKIFAEEYLEDTPGDVLTDYKFFCTNGKPTIMYICKDSEDAARADTFDMDFNHLYTSNPDGNPVPSKPEHFDTMVELAEKLSADIPFVRIDFYYVNGKIYFGEITFFHRAGFVPTNPAECDIEYGKMIDIPIKKK